MSNESNELADSLAHRAKYLAWFSPSYVLSSNSSKVDLPTPFDEISTSRALRPA